MIMKISRLFVLFFVLFSGLLYAKPVKYTMDPKHSYILWQIQHLGFSTQTGKWYVQGELLLDEAKPENSKAEATINIANIVTGLPELDKHLLGPLFLDSAKFPTADFVSNKVQILSKTRAKVFGNLTFRGVSKPVVLNVSFNKAGKDLISDQDKVGFSATALMKRSDFGMTTLLPSLGDEVKLNIEVEAYKN